MIKPISFNLPEGVSKEKVKKDAIFGAKVGVAVAAAATASGIVTELIKNKNNTSLINSFKKSITFFPKAAISAMAFLGAGYGLISFFSQKTLYKMQNKKQTLDKEI
ncbi:MAG: hypothetical protein IKU37_10530 [Candidatus Gastranaerophilales bacterium]|nr:hypothetical protein [Candidatus Gastranaerophilales bacterium]